MQSTPSTSQQPLSPRRRPGLSLTASAGLALLAVPRAVLHDLGLISPGTFVNVALVFLPPVIWVLVALRRRVPKPFLTLLVVGLWYGLFLTLTHQLLWGAAFGDTPPTLGGNLTDVDPALQNVIVRVFSAGSSLVTGALVGTVAGLVAWTWRRLTRSKNAPASGGSPSRVDGCSMSNAGQDRDTSAVEAWLFVQAQRHRD